MKFSYELNAKSAPVAGLIFGVIFLVVGLGALVFGLVNISDYNKKSKTYIEITSRVVDYKEQWDEDEKMYAIIVEYIIDGREIRKASNTYTSNPKPLGSEVKIKYNPNNPTDIIWKDDITNILLPAIGGGFAVIGLIATIISVIGMKKKKTPSVDANLESNDELYENNDLNNNVV